MTPRAVLFDLDGTLLDTAPDLALALNELRREHRLPALDFATIRPLVSHGAARVVKLGFPQATEAEFELLRERFLQLYRDSLVVHTRLFEGFEAVLGEMETREIKWGVVTNKPAFLTDPLLEQLNLSARCACIVSGDTLAQRKPHPAQLLHAAAVMNLEPSNCLYVGDAERDIQAGRAAGMRTVVAKFGYLGAEDRPEHWLPDGFIDEPGQLRQWLNGVA